MTAYNKSAVAIVQHCATPDVEHNLTTLERLSTQAAEAGADLICWAEAFAFLGRHQEKISILEPLPSGGPILERCQKLALTLDCELLLGGFHETHPDDPQRCYNTSVYLDTTGNIRATYRKIHLFDVDIENGPSLQESKHTASGTQATVVETPMGRLGLTICYDVRFPQLYQKLVDMGATLMTVPSAFTATTGAAHWHPLLRARAIETQSYVIAPAQHGQHNKNRASFGHSVIIDPWGEILAEISDGDGYALAQIDPSRIASVRQELPSLANRTPIK